MSATPARRSGTDVHLTVVLHGLRLDYRAHPTAAHLFFQEWTAHHGSHTAALLPECPSSLPRLPCERLYMELRDSRPDSRLFAHLASSLMAVMTGQTLAFRSPIVGSRRSVTYSHDFHQEYS